MTFEERRKNLKHDEPKWGDRPPQRPHHHVERTNTKARAMRLAEFDVECHCASTLDAMASSNMRRVVESISPPSHLAISTVGWSLNTILKSSNTFLPVPRISCNIVDMQTEIDNYEKSGVPFIIEGWDKHGKWPKDLFNIDSFRKEVKNITARNVHDRSDSTLEISDFIAKCRASPLNTFPEERERLYGKDAECPEQWTEWLHRAGVIPSSLLPDAQTNLLRNLPHPSSVETLMCYLGIGDTFTPCHKDLCASSGQNLMCYTEKGGSSFWFMTKGSDAPKVSEYFHELNQELDHETHVVTLEQLAAAPFCVYIAEQKLGDLVLVPPRSCHQVVNHGGITIKTSWSRMTLRGLGTAYYHELPIYRRVCRPEIYQVKATIYHTLLRYTTELENLSVHPVSQKTNLSPVASQPDLVMDINALLGLFEDILIEEYSPEHSVIPCWASPQPHAASPSPSNASSVTLTYDSKDGDVSEEQDSITCDFCGGDVFQSFFECHHCVERKTLDDSGMDEHGEPYVVCAGCYVEGRSCSCGRMTAMQRQPFDSLLQLRRKAFNALHVFTQDVSFLSALNQEPYQLSNSGVFRAARVLEQTRKHKRETKACTTTQKDSHIVAFSWALTCKKCHHAKCFAHLLNHRIHSADALLHQTSDESHEHFHKCHLVGKSAYDNAAQALLKSQEEGVRPDHRHHRVHAALTYRVCKPANPNLSLMSPGWYDMKVLSTSFDSSTTVRRPPSTRLLSMPAPTSALTTTPRASSLFPKTSTSSGNVTVNSPSLKRKCFVLVPAARYNTKRKLSNSQPSSNASKPTVTDDLKLTKPSIRNADPSFFLDKHRTSKGVLPIPRRRSVHPSGTHMHSNGSPKRMVREPNVQAKIPNQPLCLQGTERDQVSEETRKHTGLWGLKFNKYPPKKSSGAQRSLNRSSSSTHPSSSFVSSPAVDGGIEIALAFNHAATNNHNSSVNTESRTVTEHTVVTEGSADNASIQSALKGLQEQVSHLSAQFSQANQAPFQVPPPDGLSYLLHQNPSQPIVYWIVPQGPCWPQGQSTAEGSRWPQGSHHLNQAQGQFNQGPPYSYNGGPVRPHGNGHHQAGPYRYRGQHPRNNNYRQRSDHHQMAPNGRPQQPHSQGHHRDRGRPAHSSEAAPRHQNNQERFNGCSPGRSIPYRHGEQQQDHAQGFTGGAQTIHNTSLSGQVEQYRRNIIAPDVWEGEMLSEQAVGKSQEELPRPGTENRASAPSIPTDRRSPQRSPQWEDEYEQEDPVVPVETIFKASANHPSKLNDTSDLAFNPWLCVQSGSGL